MSDLTLDELAYFAAKARLPETLVIGTALETVDRFHEVWNQEKLNLPISEKIIEKIESNVKTVPLYTGQRK